ncbi:hypothetical protein ACFL6S_03450 [Candidatus Poribacteria bacterium]
MTNKISFEAGKNTLHAAAILVAVVSFIYALNNFGVLTLPVNLTAEVLILGMAVILLTTETLEKYKKENPLNLISIVVIILGTLSVVSTLAGVPITALDPIRGLIFLVTALLLAAELFTNMADQ